MKYAKRAVSNKPARLIWDCAFLRTPSLDLVEHKYKQTGLRKGSDLCGSIMFVFAKKVPFLLVLFNEKQHSPLKLNIRAFTLICAHAKRWLENQ